MGDSQERPPYPRQSLHPRPRNTSTSWNAEPLSQLTAPWDTGKSTLVSRDAVLGLRAALAWCSPAVTQPLGPAKDVLANCSAPWEQRPFQCPCCSDACLACLHVASTGWPGCHRTGVGSYTSTTGCSTAVGVKGPPFSESLLLLLLPSLHPLRVLVAGLQPFGSFISGLLSWLELETATLKFPGFA